MTDNQKAVLQSLAYAKQWLEHIASLETSDQLNPIMKDRTEKEAKNIERVYNWLVTNFTRGDTPPGSFQRTVDNRETKP